MFYNIMYNIKMYLGFVFVIRFHSKCSIFVCLNICLHYLCCKDSLSTLDRYIDPGSKRSWISDVITLFILYCYFKEFQTQINIWRRQRMFKVLLLLCFVYFLRILGIHQTSILLNMVFTSEVCSTPLWEFPLEYESHLTFLDYNKQFLFSFHSELTA